MTTTSILDKCRRDRAMIKSNALDQLTFTRNICISARLPVDYLLFSNRAFFFSLFFCFFARFLFRFLLALGTVGILNVPDLRLNSLGKTAFALFFSVSTIKPPVHPSFSSRVVISLKYRRFH